MDNEQNGNTTADLMSRLSQGSGEANQTEGAETAQKPNNGDFLSRISSAETIEDAKKLAEEAYKSFESGYTKKFQAVAEERKRIEEEKNRYSSWDKDKVLQTLNDPSFASIVDEINNADEDEDLPENVRKIKADAEAAKREVEAIKREKMEKETEMSHQSLKQKYSDYDKDTIYGFMQEISSGKRMVGFEEIYKLVNFDKKINQAYELGKKEASSSATEKFNASSSNADSSPLSNGGWKPDPGVSMEKNTHNFFAAALAKAKEKTKK